MIDKGKRNILGVFIDVVDYDAAVGRIQKAAEASQAYSVSALAVHGVMTAVQNEQQKYRLNRFDLVVPDGQPVRWALNLLHAVGLQSRVYGPELTLRTIEMCARENLAVYFYGSTPEVLEGMLANVRMRFPKLVIAGVEPSKFRTLSSVECGELGDRVVESGAKVLFVGLGCPRQEVFAYEMHGLLPMPVLAVGAAFAFLSGSLAQAPKRLQDAGLEWLFRLSREPTRLWRRYLYLNPYYLVLLAGQRAGVRFGTKGTAPKTLLRFG